MWSRLGVRQGKPRAEWTVCRGPESSQQKGWERSMVTATEARPPPPRRWVLIQILPCLKSLATSGRICPLEARDRVDAGGDRKPIL